MYSIIYFVNCRGLSIPLLCDVTPSAILLASYKRGDLSSETHSCDISGPEFGSLYVTWRLFNVCLVVYHCNGDNVLLCSGQG